MSLKKLLCLIGSLTLTVPLVTSVIACGGPTKAQPVPLSTVITESKLSNIYIGQADKPTEQQIKNELSKKYNNLQLDKIKIDIENITAISAKITSADLGVYTDEAVDITFKSDNFTKVNSVTGAVWSMATDEDGKIYVGTADGDGNGTGHLYQSADGGKTFIPIGLINEAVSCIFINKKDKNKIYVGTSIAKYDDGEGKLYRSTDATGTKFDDITDKLGSPSITNKGAVWSMISDNAGKIYVGTYLGKGNGGKLYRSADVAGTNFDDITDKLGSPSSTNKGAVWTMIIDNAGKIYIGTGAGGGTGHLFRSTDATGTKFDDITDKIADKTTRTSEAVWSMVTDKDGKMYVGTYTNKSAGHLFRSTDTTGDTFTQLDAINNAVASLTKDLNEKLYVGLEIKDSIGKKTIGKILKQTNNDVFTELSGVTDPVWSMAIDKKTGNIYAGTDINISHITGHLYKSEKDI